MDLIGTNFSLTIGTWRLRLGVAIEDTTMPEELPRAAYAQRPRFVREEEFTRNN